MTARRISLALCYAALTGTFFYATMLAPPSTPVVAMSSIAVRKTDRLGIQTPAAFETARFAG